MSVLLVDTGSQAGAGGCAQLLSHVQLFVTPRTVARQAPLSTGFPRQEYWSGLPFPFSGDLPDSDRTCVSCISRIGRCTLSTAPPGKPEVGAGPCQVHKQGCLTLTSHHCHSCEDLRIRVVMGTGEEKKYFLLLEKYLKVLVLRPGIMIATPDPRAHHLAFWRMRVSGPDGCGSVYLVQGAGLSHRCISCNHIYFQEHQAESGEQSTPQSWPPLDWFCSFVDRWHKHHRSSHLSMRTRNTTLLTGP